MKRNFPLNALLLTLLVFCASFSCSKSPQGSGAMVPEGGAGFSLADIKQSFESDYAGLPPTRADEAFDESDVLAPGWITPQWDSVSLSSGEHLIQAVIAFSARYDYRLLRRGQFGEWVLLPMPSRLVVLKDSATDQTASYLRFLIPDACYFVSGAGAGYSGLVLYTTLAGFPVSVGRFREGALSDSACLVDASGAWEENIDKMDAMLQNVVVARIRPRVTTRGIYDVNPIEPVDVVVHAPIKPDKKWEPIGPSIPPINPPFENLEFVGGGGGGGSLSADTYPQNPRIKVDDKRVIDVLDSLFLDCMGQLLINAIKSPVTITSGYYGGSTVSPIIDPLPGGSIISGYDIKIGNRLDPITVMEELMHIYQGLGTTDFRNAALNCEIEAKLAWYMYLDRHGREINYNSLLGGQDGKDYFDLMSMYFMQNDLKNPIFTQAFKNAADLLRNIPAYRNEERYPFDKGKLDMEKLRQLMRDCMKK